MRCGAGLPTCRGEAGALVEALDGLVHVVEDLELLVEADDLEDAPAVALQAGHLHLAPHAVDLLLEPEQGLQALAVEVADAGQVQDEPPPAGPDLVLDGRAEMKWGTESLQGDTIRIFRDPDRVVCSPGRLVLGSSAGIEGPDVFRGAGRAR